MAGYRVTHSCPHCANIILDLNNTNEFGRVEIDLGVTAGAANHAATDGCHFFQCVMFHIVEDFSWTPVKLLSTKKLHMTTEFKIINRNGYTSGIVLPPDGSIRRSPPRNFQWLYPCIDNPAFEHFRHKAMFEHVPREERYFSHLMNGFVDEHYDERLNELRPPKHDFLTEESHRQALSWLQQCRDNHEDCKTDLDEDFPRPKRLLRILPNSDMAVLVPDSTAPYAALSYCWGGPQRFTLTRSTLRRLEAGINTRLLSPSIQDAVKVMRSLQLSHIWVDALCIVQDDDDDKSTEIQNMAYIYYLAEITIAAGNASSAREGFLANAVPYPSFAVSVRMPHGSLGKFCCSLGSQTIIPT
ncbi:heterokaryon incompatibility protein-domain-containing protein [Phaeosphaeriaceae sp. PMI808]|nr:heterokaryon incompatibility protein-domain-containing protein [Phaeosphaeriaceae sp. PMI808]